MLVIPGYHTQHAVELEELARTLGLEADVRMPAWLPSEDVEGLYGIASCAVFPSLYEGFGLPVLEAMAHAVPVACSNRSSLPQVAGDAALLFDPEDVEAILRAMQTLLRDGDRAGELAAAGRKRAREFTWERTADLTVATYRRALAGRR
jgi:glycosyltransferase involved in cell wall biosynthesis